MCEQGFTLVLSLPLVVITLHLVFKPAATLVTLVVELYVNKALL